MRTTMIALAAALALAGCASENRSTDSEQSTLECMPTDDGRLACSELRDGVQRMFLCDPYAPPTLPPPILIPVPSF